MLPHYDKIDEFTEDERLAFEFLLRIMYYDPSKGDIDATTIAKSLGMVALGLHFKTQDDRYTAWGKGVCDKLVAKGYLVCENNKYRVEKLYSAPTNPKSTADADYYSNFILPYLNSIRALRAKGLSLADTAKAIGMKESTFARYAQNFAELDIALRTGLLNAVSDVENALYKRATGYNIDEKKVKTFLNKDGDEITETTILTKHIPPDPTSIRFFLMNRERKSWKHTSAINTFVGKLSVTNILGEVAKSEEQRSLAPLDPAKEISMSSIIDQQEKSKEMSVSDNGS